jgi:hypothetical protein
MGLPARWGGSGSSLGRAFHYSFDDEQRILFITTHDDMKLTKDDWVLIGDPLLI